MLPLLLGLGGSAMAGAGMLGSLGALGAGAIGSGLGSFIETGDLGKGIATGLTSYFGGKMLGSAFGGGADPTAAAGAANSSTALTPVGTGGLPLDPKTIDPGLRFGQVGTAGMTTAAPSVLATPPPESASFFQKSIFDPTKGADLGGSMTGAFTN